MGAAALAGVRGGASRRQVLAGRAFRARIAPIRRLVLPLHTCHALSTVRPRIAGIASAVRFVSAPRPRRRVRGA